DPTAREHDAERQSLARAAGQVVRVVAGELLELELPQRGAGKAGGKLVGDALVNEVVGRRLEQERDVSAGSHRPAVGPQDSRGGTQQGRLPRPVLTKQRDRLA